MIVSTSFSAGERSAEYTKLSKYVFVIDDTPMLDQWLYDRRFDEDMWGEEE